MLKESKRVKQPLTIIRYKNGWSRASYKVPGQKGGQSRAVYVKWMRNGKTKRFYKDSYSSDGAFQHRKYKLGGPGGVRR